MTKNIKIHRKKAGGYISIRDTLSRQLIDIKWKIYILRNESSQTM